MRATAGFAATLLAALAPGQFAVRNHRLYSLAFLRHVVPGVALGVGKRDVRFDLTWVNEFKEEPRDFSAKIREDYESQRLVTKVRWGVADGEWWAEVPVVARNGGILDAAIDWWHQLAFSYKTLRDYSAHGRVDIYAADGTRWGSAFGIGDVSGGRVWRLGAGAWMASAKVPSGSGRALLGSGGWDIGAAYAHSHQWGKWSAHALAGLVWQGSSPYLKAERRMVNQLQLGWSVKTSATESWGMEWASEPAAAKVGVRTADSAHNVLAFGFRKSNGDRTLDILLIEDGDFIFYNKAPSVSNLGADFCLSVSLTKKF